MLAAGNGVVLTEQVDRRHQFLPQRVGSDVAFRKFSRHPQALTDKMDVARHPPRVSFNDGDGRENGVLQCQIFAEFPLQRHIVGIARY